MVIPHLLACVIAATFAWWGLRGAWACLRDAVWPAATHKGCLDRIEVYVEQLNLIGVPHWVLTSGAKQWSVPRASTDSDFLQRVKPGAEIRIKYLRGTKEVVRLWVKRM